MAARALSPIGVLGGTFDPIHYGHLRIAQEVCTGLGLDQVRFMPAAIPPHREAPRASAKQRREMARLAIHGNEKFVLDDRELKREGPSYTIDTLSELRVELGEGRPFCLILGSDAFAALRSWHRWRELFDLSHVLLVQRPGAALDPERLSGPLREEWVKRGASVETLRDRPAGNIAEHVVTPLDISASAIRQMLREGKSPRYLLPESVLDYIRAENLYT